MSVDLSVNIAALTLKNPVMPASGCFGFGREYSASSSFVRGLRKTLSRDILILSVMVIMVRIGRIISGSSTFQLAPNQSRGLYEGTLPRSIPRKFVLIIWSGRIHP